MGGKIKMDKILNNNMKKEDLMKKNINRKTAEPKPKNFQKKDL